MLHEIRGREAFIFIFYFLDCERWAAEKFFFYFLHEIKGAAALEKGGAAETFYFYFRLFIGVREPQERLWERFVIIYVTLRTVNSPKVTIKVREKFFGAK